MSSDDYLSLHVTGTEAGDVRGRRGVVVEVNAAQKVVVVASQLEGQVVMTAGRGGGVQTGSHSITKVVE